MYLLDDPATVANGGVPTEGNPALNIPASRLDARHYDHLQRTILQPITDAGLQPSRDDVTQLSQAIGARTLGDAATAGMAAGLGAAAWIPGAGLDAGGVESWYMPGAWIAGLASAAPYTGTSRGGTGGPGADPNDSTDEANEYEISGLTGNDGHLFPYMVCSSTMTQSAGGQVPASYNRQGTNHYRNGFGIPAGQAISSVWSYTWFGDYIGKQARALEFVLEPEVDLDSYSFPAHAVAFQTDGFDAHNISGASTSTLPWIARITMSVTYSEPGSIPGSGNWSWTYGFEFISGGSPQVSRWREDQVKKVAYADTVIDWLDYVTIGARFKITTPGQTLGDIWPADATAQGGSEGFSRISGVLVQRHAGRGY